MKVKIKRLGHKVKVLDVKNNTRIKTLLKKLRINPEVVLVRIKGKVMPLENKISNEVEIIDVVSGG